MEYVLVGLRSLIVLVFVISLVSKLRSRDAYNQFVAATARLAPRPLTAAGARRWAVAVIASEVAVVVLVPVAAWIGFAVTAVLLAGFTTAILLALRRGDRAPCLCFGSTVQPLGYLQVVRNIVLLAAAVLGLVGGQTHTASAHWAGVLVAACAGALAATIVATADDLMSLANPVRTAPPSSSRGSRT